VKSALTIVVLAAGLALTGCESTGGGGEGAAKTELKKQETLLSALPAPARLAIERETVGGVVKKTETDEYLGRTVYTADFVTAEGQPGEVQVTRDGRVLSKVVSLKTVSFEEVPERVKAATLAKTGNLIPDEVQYESRRGKDTYSFEIVLAEVPHELVFDETGSVVSESVDINPQQLPAVVVAALGRRFSDISVTDIEEVRSSGVLTYLIVGSHQGRTVQAVFSPGGDVVSLRAR
jgi:hypothetical protein